MQHSGIACRIHRAIRKRFGAVAFRDRILIDCSCDIIAKNQTINLLEKRAVRKVLLGIQLISNQFGIPEIKLCSSPF